MTTKTKKSTSSDQLMHELVAQAKTDFENDRRSEARFPFFRSVSVQVNGQRISAFTREISDSTIGLAHKMELPLNEVEITLAGRRDGLRARVVRCESCGEGWYISGAEVVGSNVQ